MLASASRPGLARFDRGSAFYVARPRLFGPLFLLESLGCPEIARRDAWRDGRCAQPAGRAIAAPVSFGADGEARVGSSSQTDIAGDCARVNAPTLVVTGEDALDHVVPVDGTREYLRG